GCDLAREGGAAQPTTPFPADTACAKRHVAHEDFRERQQFGEQIDVDREAGVIQAEIDVTVLENKPPSLHAPDIGEFELDDDALRRQVGGDEMTMNEPRSTALGRGVSIT